MYHPETDKEIWWRNKKVQECVGRKMLSKGVFRLITFGFA